MSDLTISTKTLSISFSLRYLPWQQARARLSRGAPKDPSASPRALPRPAAASRDIRDGPTRRRRLQQRGHAPVPALLLRRRRIRREDRRHDARPSSEWWLRGEERAPRGCRSPARRGASSAVTQAPRSVEAALKRAVAPDARDPQKALKRGFTSEIVSQGPVVLYGLARPVDVSEVTRTACKLMHQDCIQRVGDVAHPKSKKGQGSHFRSRRFARVPSGLRGDRASALLPRN